MSHFKNMSQVLRDYIEVIFLAIVLAFFLRSFFVAVYKVPTEAMSPNLINGDFIFVNKIAYSKGWKFWQNSNVLPNYGDIIVFVCPENPNSHCIKRVVGLPGDEFVVKKGGIISSSESFRYDDSPSNKAGAFASKLYNLSYEIVGENKWLIKRKRFVQKGSSLSVKVPDLKIFVMGDHRDISEDSRSWGAIPQSSIIGKVSRIWLSLGWNSVESESAIPHLRWERLLLAPK